MKKKIIILIFLMPLISIGQNEKLLCKLCAHKEYHWDNGFKCNEERLREYYTYQMNKNITHVNLCKTYVEYFLYDNYFCKDLIPLEEFVSDTCNVYSIMSVDGFYYDDHKNFIPHKFYLISFGFKDTIHKYGGCLIVYDLNKFKENLIYESSVGLFDKHIEYLKNTDYTWPNTWSIQFAMDMRAYFDRDIWAIKAEDGSIKTLLGDKPAVDIVYKKYIIPNIYIDRYYFEAEIESDDSKSVISDAK